MPLMPSDISQGGFIIGIEGGKCVLREGGKTVEYYPNRALLTTTGTVLAVIGLVLIIWPGVGVVTISWLVAALAFLTGAVLVFLALRLGRVKRRVYSLGKLSW
jgi:hypothetical protein